MEKNNTYETVKTSNEDYKKFLNDVANFKGKQEELHVLIIKRENVEKFRVLEDQ